MHQGVILYLPLLADSYFICDMNNHNSKHSDHYNTEKKNVPTLHLGKQDFSLKGMEF